MLLDQLQNKDKMLKEMSQTKYPVHPRPPLPKHKVISSADSKKKSERRRKEEQTVQVVFFWFIIYKRNV